VSDSIVLPDVDVGRGARLTRVVVDKGCKIPEGLVVGEYPEEDAKRFYVTKKGITLITPEMLGQQLHHVR
ncbi:MAG: glucose-1-phosphate adenylyltransferase, partial [Sulfuricella sp.]|nr:glucose-1-phosphate adenylyltransferase [Sulfuricella sp.]